jgi:hypothetical protein
VVGRADLQSVDRPDEPLRCLARHARAIALRAREAVLIYSMSVSVDGFIADREGAVLLVSAQRGPVELGL